MKILQPSANIISFIPSLMENIEYCGRVAYRSEDQMITKETASAFIHRLRNPVSGEAHESVLEHGSITVEFICDIGVGRELLRHRLSSPTQESTRYTGYAKEKFGHTLCFIQPPCKTERGLAVWKDHAAYTEYCYMEMIDAGEKPEIARSTLSLSLLTKIILTANPREWLHIFKLRTHLSAHPQMRNLMQPLHEEFCSRWNALFTLENKNV